MTTSTRLAPVRRDVRRPPPPLRAPEPPRSAPVRRAAPASFERVLVWSILLSAGLHLLLLLVSPIMIRPTGGSGGVAVPGDDAAPEPIGMEWIIPVLSEAAEERDEMTAADESPVTAPTTPPPSRDGSVPRALQVRPGPGDAGSAGARESAEAPASVGESLRPGYRDGRLYVDPRELRVEQAPARHAEYMAHLQARIDALNDSTYGGGPNTDWTRTDSEGRRWGVSPAGVHLGNITVPRWLLPIPGPTGTNQDMEEDRERARQRGEIIRQEEERAREQARERSRKAAEERRRRGGGGGEDGG